MIGETTSDLKECKSELSVWVPDAHVAKLNDILRKLPKVSISEVDASGLTDTDRIVWFVEQLQKEIEGELEPKILLVIKDKFAESSYRYLVDKIKELDERLKT